MLRKIMFLIIVILSSCREDSLELKKQYLIFTSNNIVIPNDMLLIQEGEKSPFVSSDLPHLVVYTDSNSCASCGLYHLGSMYELFEDPRYGEQYDVIPIFSPKKSMLDEILDEAMYVQHNLPMIIDVNGTFAKENKNIPTNDLFHVFLLKDSFPVYVGNPCQNRKMKHLFNMALKRE